MFWGLTIAEFEVMKASIEASKAGR